MSRALLCLLLAGCAGAWTREGATAEDLRRDEAACRARAASASSGAGGLAALATYEGVKHDCMVARGWLDG